METDRPDDSAIEAGLKQRFERRKAEVAQNDQGSDQKPVARVTESDCLLEMQRIPVAPETTRVCVACGGGLEPGRGHVCASCERGAAAKAPGVGQREADQRAKLVRELADFHQPEIVDSAPSREAPGFVEDEWNHDALVWAGGGDPTRGVWLAGGSGSGKTTALAIAVRRVQAAGRPVCVCTVQHLLGKLVRLRFRRSRAAEDHYAAALRALAQVDVLALDDILASSLSRPELDELLAVADTRLNARRGILVTSNYERGPGLAKAQKWWSDEDPAAVERLLSRVYRATGIEIPCFYPGDRRKGRFLASEAPQLRSMLATWGDR